MARKFTIEPSKTYISEGNAIRAVEKLYPRAEQDGLRYFIKSHTDGRFFPVFVGNSAVNAGVHFHFNVIS